MKQILDSLLETWRQHRQPEVADLAEAVAAAVLAKDPRPAIGATKKASDRSTWRDVAAQRDPLDFPRLVLAARGGSQIDVKLQVQYLSDWNHPSLGLGLLELLENPPYAGIKSRPMLEEIFEALRNTRDVRLVKPARKLAKRYLSIVNSSTGGWIVSELERIAKTLEALSPPEISAAERVHYENIGKSLPPEFRPKPRGSEQSGPDIESLLAAVYEHPDDDEKRLRFAEAIREEDPERAEFIQLQIGEARGTNSAEESARLKALNTDAKRAGWAQPISMSGYCEFARGFPVSIRLYKTALGTIGEKAWATIEQVDALGALSQKATITLLDHPNLANVKSVSPLLSKVLANLDDRVRIWTTLNLVEEDTLDAELLRRVPMLRELKLQLRGGPAIDEPNLLRNLEHLHKLEIRPGRNAKAIAICIPPTVTEAIVHGDVGPGIFATANKLEKLSIWSMRIEKAHLNGLTNLKWLDVRADQFDAEVFEAIPMLDELRISLPRSNAVLPRGILGPLKHLKTLDLSYTQLEPGELGPLVELKEVYNHWLELDGVPTLPSLTRFHCMLPRTVSEIEAFLERNPTVRALDFCWNSSSELWFYGEATAKCAQPWEQFADALTRSKIESWGCEGKLAVIRRNGSWRIEATEKTPAHDYALQYLVAKIAQTFGISTDGIPAALQVRAKR